MPMKICEGHYSVRHIFIEKITNDNWKKDSYLNFSLNSGVTEESLDLI